MLCASPSRRPFPLQTALSHAVYPSSGNQSRESQNFHWLLSKEKEASRSVLCLLEGKLLGNHYSNIEHHPKTFCYQCGVDKTLERLLFLGSKDPKSETWCFPRNEGALGSSWLVIQQSQVWQNLKYILKSQVGPWIFFLIVEPTTLLLPHTLDS